MVSVGVIEAQVLGADPAVAASPSTALAKPVPPGPSALDKVKQKLNVVFDYKAGPVPLAWTAVSFAVGGLVVGLLTRRRY